MNNSCDAQAQEVEEEVAAPKDEQEQEEEVVVTRTRPETATTTTMSDDEDENDEDVKYRLCDENKEDETGLGAWTGWLSRKAAHVTASPAVRGVLRAAWIPLVIGLGIATVRPGIGLVDVLAPINLRDRTQQ